MWNAWTVTLVVLTVLDLILAVSLAGLVYLAARAKLSLAPVALPLASALVAVVITATVTVMSLVRWGS